MGNNIRIESEVPFGRVVYARLYLRDLQLDQMVRHDQIETHYLAWETVRKETNPFFQKGTGFEGYLIGNCANPEAALEAIISINQNILDAIARLYHLRFGFQSRLMKTLTKESNDSEAIHTWSAYLGAELGKLRSQIIPNPKAQRFRNQTYKIVKTLPPMDYHEIEEDITQSYAIGSDNSTTRGKLIIAPHVLKPDQQDAWVVADNIGEFGHPLVRKLLDRA